MAIEIDYQNSVVAFLDVLGFRDILKKKEAAEDYFNAVMASIGDLSKSELKAVLISDSVVLKIPMSSPDPVRNMLVAVARVQSDLAVKDIWLRGGITIGNFDFQSQGDFQIVVGEALARAYELESKFARVPRVLIDPSLGAKLEFDRTELLKHVEIKGAALPQPIFDMQAPDDKPFLRGSTVVADGLWIDYAYLVLSDENKLRAVAKNLRKRLYNGQEHYEKYRWVQSYFHITFSNSFFEKKYGAEYDSLDKLIGNL